jgi:LDH2 family malate/lactate/ureidoglycolate dehydrogenase
MLSEVTSWNLDLKSRNNAGHAFIAIDISKMIPMELFEKRIESMINELKNAPKAKHADQIFVPGEMEWEKREKAVETGVLEITDAIADNLKSLSEKMEITLNITE